MQPVYWFSMRRDLPADDYEEWLERYCDLTSICSPLLSTVDGKYAQNDSDPLEGTSNMNREVSPPQELGLVSLVRSYWLICDVTGRHRRHRRRRRHRLHRQLRQSRRQLRRRRRAVSDPIERGGNHAVLLRREPLPGVKRFAVGNIVFFFFFFFTDVTMSPSVTLAKVNQHPQVNTLLKINY